MTFVVRTDAIVVAAELGVPHLHQEVHAAGERGLVLRRWRHLIRHRHAVQLTTLAVDAGLTLGAPGFPLAIEVLLNEAIRLHGVLEPVVHQAADRRLCHPGSIDVLANLGGWRPLQPGGWRGTLHSPTLGFDSGAEDCGAGSDDDSAGPDLGTSRHGFLPPSIYSVARAVSAARERRPPRRMLYMSANAMSTRKRQISNTEHDDKT